MIARPRLRAQDKINLVMKYTYYHEIPEGSDWGYAQRCFPLHSEASHSLLLHPIEAILTCIKAGTTSPSHSSSFAVVFVCYKDTIPPNLMSFGEVGGLI
jgi:hypothetical protein